MDEQVIEISTRVFRMLKKRDPWYVDWSDEKPGPTQRILVEDDVYREFIDRAIAKRKSLDEVLLAFAKNPGQQHSQQATACCRSGKMSD
jgi:hypothetical protein